MPRWKALPEELDPEVRELTAALRMLVDRGGSGIAAVADSTGYSRTSWERYLNGRLLPPKGAVIALAEVTGVNPLHLTTLWELAERSWSRAEMRHDLTIEAMRIAQAREGLGQFAGPSARPPATASAGPVVAPDSAAPAPPSAGAPAPGVAAHEPYDSPGAAPHGLPGAAAAQARTSAAAAPAAAA
ncbi:helix-turn-helix domain-containing protein, partial [Streptomyces sp. NPDC056600]|uniref:helix-turn-helix domain-containing protein n=1 Tax=Streptomyces sp. NPDC056600 TaxID=3345874 RepID=UPI00369A9D90